MKTKLNLLDQFNRNVKIRTKIILLITGIVLISVVPLSLIVLYRNQSVVLNKTFEVCQNLAINISNLATEELLINETYDTTKTSIKRLKESNITGLLDSYVINIDGKYVAELNEKHTDDEIISGKEKTYFANLKELEMKEDKGNKGVILRYAYPIFISYKHEKMRVGTAVFEFDKSKVYEPVVQIRTTIIGVSGILFVLSLVIAGFFAIFFSKPIQKLSEGAEIIGSGNLNHRINLSGRDEIGQLAQRFNNMTSEIQDFTQNLELKVKQRTEELNRTLEEVKALKVAQDGDYYLTSLLLKPLQPNNNTSKNIQTEFLIEQKKKFNFRKWDSEIGGDICVTDTIKLSGRDYTVFINGDAMGKSIQGAGGALVLGVVFNAGLIRSKIEKYQNTFPETWLKERFLDLHNVFLSFDGSMYISVCMGLVDNQTGMLYYINAEHPWTVLYRDGKASFLEEELTLRKIGTPEQEEKFHIRTFQLMDGDEILTGSDGKDDLILKRSDGTEFVQEDEKEFLRRVEEGEGDIYKIANRIINTGKLMDDFSILKISYHAIPKEVRTIPDNVNESIQKAFHLIGKGNHRNAIKQIKSFMDEYKGLPDLLKLLGKVYYQKGDYPKAIECFEQYLAINPGDNEYIYALSNTYRMAGDLNAAADIGERLYLRDPNYLLNLINLASIYISLKVLNRAELMLRKGQQIDSNNSQIEILYSILKERRIEKLKGIETEQQITSDLEEKLKAEGDNLLHEAEEAYERKQYENALMLYLRVLDDGKFENTRVLLKIGNCYSSMKNTAMAISYYNRTLSTDPLNYHALNNLAGVYFQQGRYKEAHATWSKTIAIKPDFKLAQLNLKRVGRFIESNT